MKEHDSEEIDTLLATASALETRERASFLDDRCAGRPQLRAEVESLLAAHQRAGRFLEVATAGGPLTADALTTTNLRGTAIGSFRLLEPIGHGGMGTVYRAERADGGFAQHVAIKVIAAPISHAGAARRFRAERQILASLSHPHIVSLLDGGVTPEGYAYLVMEYVEGQPIDAYCREHNLTLADRLRLFRTVCSAVHYAHRHAIVHRDLKPANILVTNDGVPKVLDFGVAKLVDESAVAGATATGLGVGPLTPNYASPEQLRGLALTTSSDVYALGVLLYELVAGVRPYETAGKPLDEVMRLVVDAEPLRPSAAIPSAASRLPYDPRRMLRGDLDAVTLRAMSKEPERRYGSAEELADDLARYLADAPVAAREPSFGYVARKLAARNKAAFVTASVSLVVIVSALLLALWQARVATMERDRARLEGARAQQVSAFLRGLFTSNLPRQAQGERLTARDLLDNGVRRIDADLGAQPDVRASMLALLGSVYTEMGLAREALPLLEQSLAVRETLFGAEHVDVAESLFMLGRLKNRGFADYETAERLLTRAVAIRERLVGPDDPLLPPVLNELGSTLGNRGRHHEGRAYLQRAVTIAERTGSPDLPKWITTLSNFESSLGDYASSQRLLERALDLGLRNDGRITANVDVAMLNLGTLLRAQEDFVQARAILEKALELCERTYGAEHQAVIYAWGEVGDLYLAMGEARRARELLERAIATGERNLGPDHPAIGPPLTYYARLQLAEGRPREALAILERVLRIRARALGPTHGQVAGTLAEIARVKARLEGPAAAEPFLRRALDMQRETMAPGHPFFVPTLTSLAETVLARDEKAEARSLLIEAVDIARTRMPERHSERRRAEALLERLESAASRASR